MAGFDFSGIDAAAEASVAQEASMGASATDMAAYEELRADRLGANRGEALAPAEGVSGAEHWSGQKGGMSTWDRVLNRIQEGGGNGVEPGSYQQENVQQSQKTKINEDGEFDTPPPVPINSQVMRPSMYREDASWLEHLQRQNLLDSQRDRIEKRFGRFGGY